jgi:predicted enzyme related to lactoylglutathione lyase
MTCTSSLFYPVSDLPLALALFRDRLGMSLRFRDGARYAALDAGGVSLALLAGTERIVDRAALGLRVPDLHAAVKTLVAAGAQIVSAPEPGPHEWRAVLREPGGNPLVLSQRLQS